jgi:hypothetical protein
MDRNWNRSGSNSSSNTSSSTGFEKIYRHPYSGGGQYHNYRKKNDFSGPEYYSKTAKQVFTQQFKKDSLQVALVENELMDINFLWIKNFGAHIQ